MEPNKPIGESRASPAAGTPHASSNASDFSHLPRGLLGKKGLPVGRGTRLPSIRSPRDLTLGGTPKRTFTPNIPVRRDRSKDGDAKAQLSDSHRHSDRGSHRGMRGRGGERGRGRGRGHSDLIQIQGAVFGEGLANTAMKRGSYGDYSRDDTKSQMPVPKYTSAPLKTKKEREEEEMRLKDLLRDDFIDNDDEMENKIHPVILPMTKGTKTKTCSDTTVKPEVKVKIEKSEACDLEEIKSKVEVLKKVERQEVMDEEMSSETEEVCPKDLFCDSNIPETGKLLFFQFPSCLPGSLRQDEDVKPNLKKEPSVSGSPLKGHALGNQDNSDTCKLADLPEGCIGKLQILKSGKTRFLMGPVVYNIEMGTPVGFLQDLVSVRVNQDSGDMTVLGHVHDKLVCIPDMESLLAACL